MKLNSLINKEMKRNKQKNIEFKIISNSNKKIKIKIGGEFELLKDYRIKIECQEYVILRNNIKSEIKRLITDFYDETKRLKDFQIFGHFIPRLIELPLSKF